MPGIPGAARGSFGVPLSIAAASRRSGGPASAAVGTLPTLTLTPTNTGTFPYFATIFPAEGALPSGQFLVSADDATTRGVVHSTWPDGSARVVIVAGQRTFPTTAALNVTLQATGSNPGGTDLTEARVAALLTDVRVNVPGQGNVTFNAWTTHPTRRVWWASPQLICVQYVFDVGGLFSSLFVHAFNSHPVAFVEFVVENSRVSASSPTVTAPTNTSYTGATVSITPVGGATTQIGASINATDGMAVPRAAPGKGGTYAIGHEGLRAWHRAGWVNGSVATAEDGASDPRVEPTHDAASLQAHPMFWKPLQPSSKTFSSAYTTSYDTYEPWATCRQHVPGMNGGGDDQSIALFTEEQCDYIHTGDRYARRAAIANGLALLSLNINVRDSATLLVPQRAQYLGKSTADGGTGTWPRAVNAPRYGGTDSAASGGAADGSHIPAAPLIPFLCRPSPVFIELAQKEFVWNHTNYASENGWHEYDQHRSHAWRNRNYTIACFLTPDAETTRKADMRTVLGLNATNLLRFYAKSWNTLEVLWKYGPEDLFGGEISNGGVAYCIAFQAWFCAMAWHLLDKSKVVINATDAQNWDTLADNAARLACRIVNESTGGEWRKQSGTHAVGPLNTAPSPDEMVQLANHGLQQKYAVLGNPPIASEGVWLNGQEGAGGTNDWQTMPEWNSAWGYEAQFWFTISIAVEREVAGAETAYDKIYTKNELTNFQVWRTRLASTPRFNRFPRNKTDSKAMSALETAARAMSLGGFITYYGGGLNTNTVTHPNTGFTNVPPLRDGRSSTGNYTIGYSGKGCYDHQTKRALFMATGASTGGAFQNNEAGAYIYNTRPIYNEATDLWSADRAFKDPDETNPPNIGHTYDGNCIDVRGRRQYKVRNDSLTIYVYNLDTGAMETSIALPANHASTGGEVGGLEFIPSRGANGALWLFSHNSSNQLVLWEKQLPAGSWTVLHGVETFAEGVESVGPTISYNPRAFAGVGGVMLGSRNGQWVKNCGTMAAPVAIARPNSRPLDVAAYDGGEASGLCRDPVGDGWIKFSAVAGRIYRWAGAPTAPGENRWTDLRSATVDSGIFGSVQEDFIVIPIDAYGVIWVIRFGTNTTFDYRGALFRPPA